MSEAKIYLCCPVDRSGLPQVPELDAIVITDLYEQDNCDRCAREVWVGPRQHAARELAPGPLICYQCGFHLALDGELDNIIELGGGSGREGVPR